MAEEIKVVLEADARQLTSEFKKAQAAAEALSNKALPLVQQGLNTAYLQGEKLRKGMKESGRGFNDAGGKMLVFAQAADDAQYGMRGLSNQIPQLAQAIGLGGGLAGAIGIAAVAVTVLLPLLKKLYTDTDAPKINAVADAVAKRYALELEGLRKVAREKELQEQVGALTRDMAAYAAQELRIQDQRLTVIENQRREMELQRGLADELAAAVGGPTASASNRVDRTQQDLELARKEAKIANSEYDRIAIEQANVKSAAEARLAAADAEIARLQRNVAGSKSSLAGADEAEKQGLAGYGERRGAAQLKLEKDTALLEKQTALATRLREEIDKANSQANGVLGDLSARIDAAERQKRIYQEQLPVLKQLAELEKERNRQAAITAAADGPLNDMESLLGDLPAIKAKAKAESDRAAALASSRKSFAEDQAVFELRARGMNVQADALEKEIALRRQAVVLAKELGIAEDQATELLRRRQRIMQAGAGGGEGAVASKILRGGRTAGLQVNGLETARGLRTTAEERERRARTPVANTMEARAASYYDRSLQNEERMIKALEALGVF
jgi:hypothetical protein